ncbi:MAG: NAD(P)-binding domain-containing protein, partial [Pseudolabrys sp.]
MARIGFIGLGNMGLPMAQNLIKAGHQVEGVDVNAAAVAKLVAAGGAGVETAKTAAAGADVVITMLPAAQGVQHRVLAWSDVGEAEGTGIVHIAPSCGKEDLQ